MIRRLISSSYNSSFFLFGARGTGKTTYILEQFLAQFPPEKILVFDLLDDETEERLRRRPNTLAAEIDSRLRTSPLEWVLIDEIQKVPRLLDVVHSLIEKKKKIKFILSGSSSRKLKIGGANLLAGRAFEYRLFPLLAVELKDKFDLDTALSFGALPSIQNFQIHLDRVKYLQSYVRNYVKQEVQLEHLVKNIEPYREFLEIAAQTNAKILNYTKLGRELGVDSKTVKQYYDIIEDTYLGFRLPTFHNSLRKSQLLSSKFYYFDIGVKRSLEGALNSAPVPGTSYYGDTFEHFVILEFYRMNCYLETDYRLSYFSTSEGSEIDLVLSRGKKLIFIEIKSSETIDEVEVRKVAKLGAGTTANLYYLSRNKYPQDIEGVRCLPWDMGLREIFAVLK